MFAASKTATPAGGGTDPQFNYVTMLLHGDGTNGAQNNTFLDSSTNNFTITRNGNVTQGTFSPFSKEPGKWGVAFDGSGDYLTSPVSSGFDFGTGDYTVEGWVYTTSTTFTLYATGGAGSKDQFVVDGGTLYWGYSDGPFTGLSGFFTPSDLNKWVHVAVSRSGTSQRYFKDGIVIGTLTSSASYGSSSNPPQIGRRSDGMYYTNGAISNLRVVKGAALYTSNFTPSTTPLTAVSGTSLLCCQDNRFIDNSSNNFTLTPNGDVKVTPFSPFAPSAAYSPAANGGSGYFDGSGDYLSAANNAAFNFGTGDFTVEWWMYCAVDWSAMSNPGIAGQKVNDGSDGWQIYRNSVNNPTTVNIRITQQVDYTSNATPITATWEHWAVTRSGTTLRWYKNGTLTNTFTGVSANVTDSTGTMNVGYTQTWGGYFNGYISNLRILKGTALYTTTYFTPPTAPVTAVSNTSLLLNFTNGAIYDNAMMNDLETVGNAQISTSVVKYGTGSLAFDGTGDYLSAPHSTQFEFGSGDFTVEAWIYLPTTSSNFDVIAASWLTGNSTDDSWYFGLSASNQIIGGVYTTASTLVTSSGAISNNTWTHVAFVRNGGSLYLFINGVRDAATGSVTGVVSNGTYPLRIGGLPNGYDLNGYIDDLRITKGYARYTSNFTPPTAAFPNQ